MSPQNMVKIAEFEITQRDLYMPESRTPIKGGVLDLRLVRLIYSCILFLIDN
jgi:DNA-directed RNA polymerase III subunit RPC1